MEILINGVCSHLLVNQQEAAAARDISCRLNTDSYSLLGPGDWSALPPNHPPEVLLLMASPRAVTTAWHLERLRRKFPAIPIILLLDTSIVENLEETLNLGADDFHDFHSGNAMLEARVKKWRSTSQPSVPSPQLVQDETAVWRTLFQWAGAGMLTGNPSKFLNEKPSSLEGTEDWNPSKWNAFIQRSLLQMKWEMNNFAAHELLELNEPTALSSAFILGLEALNPAQFAKDLYQLGAGKESIEGDFQFKSTQGFHKKLTLIFSIPLDLRDIILVTITDITARVDLEVKMRNHLIELESRVKSRTHAIRTVNKQLEEESKQRKRLTQQVRESLVNITQGIISAKMILDIALPGKEELRAIFPQSMLIERPRDIMGGDFLFTAEKNGKKFLALVDSTGHGIPGAMVSLMGSNMINRAFIALHAPNPSSLLEHFHNEFRERIQINKGTSNMYGFDGGIIMLDEDEQMLSFSGAKGDLYLVRNGETQIFRGTRSSIELNKYRDDNALHYELHAFHLEPGDQLYMVTDGVRDQFGGERNRKLGRKRLADIMAQCSPLGMIEREKALQQALLLWKGPNTKVDDATLVGLEFPIKPQFADPSVPVA